MPADIPGGDFDSCVDIMMEEQDYDEETAERVCGALEEERKAEHGDPESLWEAIKDGAGLIADVGVDLVSGVDVPAIDSKWVAMKSDSEDHDWRANVPILKAETKEQRISYAAAMIPREPDKEGDVAPTPTVEKAAHNFLTSNGGVDTDHSLIDGEGEPVESWLLKEERTFDLHDGSEETYPKGTWMLGIKWDAEPWERIKSGDLTGLSIYGMAEHVALSAKNCDCGDEAATTLMSESQESKDMGQDIDHEALAESLAEPLAESLGDSVASNVSESVKDALPDETFKQDDDVTELINEFVERLADMDEIEREADAIRDDIRAALTEPEEKEEDEDEEEDEEEEMEESAEETEKDANLEKGTDAREVASKGIDAEASGSSTGGSYAALLEERGD